MADNSQPSSMQESLPEWLEVVRRSGERLYYNTATGEPTLTKPSGSICTYSGDKDLPEWEVVVFRDGRRCYVNNWTGDSTWTRPSGVQSIPTFVGDKDLPEWEEVIYPGGKRLYYNNWTAESTDVKPVELMSPNEIADLVKSTTEEAEQLRRENEALKTQLRRMEETGKGNSQQHIPLTDWEERTAANGRKYYYNKVTRKTTRQVPEEVKVFSISKDSRKP